MTMSPERELSRRDFKLAAVIASQSVRWPSRPTEDPIWGLLRIIMAQQISTKTACGIANRLKSAYPGMIIPSSADVPKATGLRALGLTERRAECCVDVVRRSDEIRACINCGKTWEDVLVGIKGIGPWTIAVFRIMVLRDPDVLPMGDVGLIRAIANVYGAGADIAQLGEVWKPFRSVACWYLWRTLGNEQLG